MKYTGGYAHIKRWIFNGFSTKSMEYLKSVHKIKGRGYLLTASFLIGIE